MFEHFTEKARRVIFFARYEASEYGSRLMETEHILLGLLREDAALMQRCFGPGDVRTQIRAAVEKAVKRGSRISTSVELPISDDLKRVLAFAAEEADKLGHRNVGTEDILLGILRLPESLASKLLLARGAKAEAIREIVKGRASTPAVEQPASTMPFVFVDKFLGALKGTNSEAPADFFEASGHFVDSSGKRWIGQKEIEKAAETLFARFRKKNASFRLEETAQVPFRSVVASVIWEFASTSADRSKSMLRMSVVLFCEGNEWTIVLVQVTPILLGETLPL